MDFKTVILFLCIYFLRPQDWIPGLEGLNIVTPIMAVAILAMFFRPDGFKARDLLRTPADWMILTFYVYAVATSETSYETMKEAFPLFAFYFVTRQALNTPERLHKYLQVWLALLIVITALAVASVFGIDITRAGPIMERMNGRLVLNTWMLNNPNALGHSIIAGIPLVYFYFYWKKPGSSKIIAIFLIALMAFCVYRTESKGAFLSGFATLTVSMMFNRPKIAQAVILALALSVGMTALYHLPRMGVLRDARSDEGIMGRLLAWEQAREAADANRYGKGWKKFVAWIEWDEETVEKSTHGSYVKIAADLGYPGLFLFVGILYCGLRVLVQARTVDIEEDRIRRMLFVILFSYCVSAWMIDRAYHTEFYVMAAAISAFHLMLRSAREEEEDDEEEKSGNVDPEAVPVFLNNPGLFGIGGQAPSLAGGYWGRLENAGGDALVYHGAVNQSKHASPDGAAKDEDENEDEELDGRIDWTRLGLLDFVIMFALLRFTLWLWDYIMKNL